MMWNIIAIISSSKEKCFSGLCYFLIFFFYWEVLAEALKFSEK